MISIFKALIPDEYNKKMQDDKEKDKKQSKLLTQKAEESKSRFEKSLKELEELLIQQKNV